MLHVRDRAVRAGRACRRSLSCAVLAAIVGASAPAHAAGAPAEPGPKVAVMPLTAVRVPADLVTVLDELLLNELYARGRYSIISLSDMNALLGFERVKSMVDCSDLACAADIGGALGVRYLLAGTVAKLGNQIIVTLKLLDTQQQRVDARAEYSVDNDESRFAGAIRVAVGRLVGEEVATAAPSPGVAPAASAPGRLEITTKPAGAACDIDGKPIGKSPCKVDALPAGNYTVRVQLTGYSPHVEILAIAAGKTTARVIALQAAPIAVRFTSEPAGASVTLDGTATVAGKTPFTAAVAPGEHEARFAAEGWVPRTQPFTVVAGARSPAVDALLTPVPGRIVVSSTPEGAEATLSGRPETCTTNCALTVLAGKYELKLRRDGFADAREAVTVAAGKDTQVALALTPRGTEPPAYSSRKTWASVLTAATGVAIGVFAWQGLRARTADRDLASLKVGTAEASAKQDEGRSAARVADVALAASVLGAAGASYLWVKVAF